MSERLDVVDEAREHLLELDPRDGLGAWAPLDALGCGGLLAMRM